MADEALDPLADFRAGSTEPWTSDLIGALIRALKPHNLIETGTFEARTTRVMLEAMASYAPEHGSFLRTIEFDPKRAQAAADFLVQIQMPQGIGYEVLQGDALDVLRALPDDSLDFIFIDDSHDQTHVSQEVVEARRALRPRGLIAMHDVLGPFGLNAVVKFHEGILLDIPRLHQAGGLGLISK